MTEQTRANHVRFDPKFHFFLAPLFAINFVWAVWRLVQNFNGYALWSVVVSAASIVMLLTIRTYSLKVQDRVIRLEERLRIVPLLPPGVRGRWAELSERQLIALRFASDAEVGALGERAINEKLDEKAIKAAIQTWRPDYFRV